MGRHWQQTRLPRHGPSHGACKGDGTTPTAEATAAVTWRRNVIKWYTEHRRKRILCYDRVSLRSLTMDRDGAFLKRRTLNRMTRRLFLLDRRELVGTRKELQKGDHAHRHRSDLPSGCRMRRTVEKMRPSGRHRRATLGL